MNVAVTLGLVCGRVLLGGGGIAKLLDRAAWCVCLIFTWQLGLRKSCAKLRCKPLPLAGPCAEHFTLFRIRTSILPTLHSARCEASRSSSLHPRRSSATRAGLACVYTAPTVLSSIGTATTHPVVAHVPAARASQESDGAGRFEVTKHRIPKVRASWVHGASSRCHSFQQ